MSAHRKLCWRCLCGVGVGTEKGEPYQAIIWIKMADRSFCGWFPIELCGCCARDPHNCQTLCRAQPDRLFEMVLRAAAEDRRPAFFKKAEMKAKKRNKHHRAI